MTMKNQVLEALNHRERKLVKYLDKIGYELLKLEEKSQSFKDWGTHIHIRPKGKND